MVEEGARDGVCRKAIGNVEKCSIGHDGEALMRLPCKLFQVLDYPVLPFEASPQIIMQVLKIKLLGWKLFFFFFLS